jgi:hypothetical protein
MSHSIRPGQPDRMTPEELAGHQERDFWGKHALRLEPRSPMNCEAPASQ